MATNSDVKVNITTWFDAKGLTAAEKEIRRAYLMQERAAKEMAAADEQTARRRKDAMNGVANTLLATGAAMTALAGLAAAKWAQFDSAMSAVASSGADAKNNLGALSDAALEAGQRTAYSATEAAAAIEDLAKAGLSASTILSGALDGSLDLAAAGAMEVADAAGLVATTLTQFGLAGERAGHVADVLAAAAGKAYGDVSDLGLGLQYVGPVASQMGVSLEETAGALALFAQQGILGEKAGTGLRGVLMSLTAPSKEAASAMEEYGINVFDAHGNFIGLAGVAGQLQTKLGGLDEATRSAALGQIFGNAQVTAARVLYAGGAKDVAEWTAAVDDAGYAQEAAAERMDNLRGDVEQLSGAWETALIKMGRSADGPARSLVQGLTGAVDALGDLPPAAQTALMTLVGGGGLLTLGAGGAIKLTTALGEAKTAMAALGWTARGVTLATGAVGAALGLAALAFQAWSSSAADARQRVDDYTQALQGQTEAITENVRAVAAKRLADDGVLEAARRLGVSSELIVDAITGEAGAYEEVTAQLEAFHGTAQMGAAEREQMRDDVNDVTTALGRESDALSEARDLQELTAEAVGETASAHETATAAVDEETASIKELIDALDALNGASQSREQAEINWQDQLAKTAQVLAEGTKTLDLTTAAGRENRQSMLDMAEAAQELAQRRLEQTGNEEQFRQTLEQARAALFAQARQFFATDEEAQAYVDTLLSVPAEVETEVEADTAQAESDINHVARDRESTISVSIAPRYSPADIPGTPAWYASRGITFPQADGGIVEYYASGGIREAHIAADGANRILYAERGTGGEAFIPLAPSKRARSTDILEDVAGRFGYQLSPAGAGGGITVNVGDVYGANEGVGDAVVTRLRDHMAARGIALIGAGV